MTVTLPVSGYTATNYICGFLGPDFSKHEECRKCLLALGALAASSLGLYSAKKVYEMSEGGDNRLKNTLTNATAKPSPSGGSFSSEKEKGQIFICTTAPINFFYFLPITD